jgi:tRNA pseudouridine38-40 synthase
MTKQIEAESNLKDSYYYKATIQYDGTGYSGFQWQKEIPTIQNDFNQAIQKIIQGKVTTMGASRTDTGVHAMVQLVKITSQIQIDCPTFVVALNQMLPAQIRCVHINPCSRKFKPASDPESKEYRYYFTNKRNVSPEERRFISNFSVPLNFDLMRICSREILGTQNFQNFCSTGSNVKTTIREITKCELTEINPHSVFSPSDLFYLPQELTHCYQLRIEGNGFLKQMIRHIMSAQWMVGSGKLTTEEFIELLKGPKKEKRLWKVAAPNGLFLHEIRCSEDHPLL